MKKLLVLILPIIITVSVFAQNTNTWVDYNKTYYKIKVAETGMYTLSYETLVAAGFPIESIIGNELLLINEGKEIPIFVSNTNKWTESDYLEFFGKKLDGSFDTQLYENPAHQMNTRFSMFADTAVYYLTTGITEKRITYFESSFENVPAKEAYFMHEVEYAERALTNLGKPDGKLPRSYAIEEPKPTSTFFLSSYGAGETYLSKNFSNTYKYNSNLNTPSIYTNGPNASMQLQVVGMNENDAPITDHHLQLELNNEIIFDKTFDGYDIATYQSSNISLNNINTNSNTIILSSLTDTTYFDRIGLAYLTINYPRNFDFKDISTLEFYLEENVESQYIEFENLEENEPYFLTDLTNNLKTPLIYLEDSKVHVAHFLPSNNKKRHLYLHKADETKSIEQLQRANFKNYNELSNQGDYIIISHPQLENQNLPILQYANYRASAEGGNYKPVIVNVEELYDQYSYGIAKHPLAIKYFLNGALENWTVKPKHCFLIGKGIMNNKALNPDNWKQNLVPTFGYTTSDQVFGAEDFSTRSRLAIGRLSASQPQQVLNYLNKVKTVEMPKIDDPCNYIKEEKWRHQIVQIPGYYYYNIDTLPNLFYTRIKQQANIAANGKTTATSNYIFTTDNREAEISCGLTPPQPLNCLKANVQQGTKIISFLGHSNALRWSFDIGSLDEYSFNERYPILIGQDNYSGNIYNPNYDWDDRKPTIPLEWLNSAYSGATAYIGFTGNFGILMGADFVDELYHQMFVENPELTLGEQLNKAILKYYSEVDSTKKYATNAVTYSGDPALKYYSNNQPEVALNKENINIDIDKVNDLSYHLRIQFQFAYLNIAETQEVAYQITKVDGTTQTIIEQGLAKPNETIYVENNFEVSPNQAYQFVIEVDYENTFNEICESNNEFSFQLTDGIVGIDNTALSNTAISNYPNPFSTYTIFEFNTNSAKSASLEIINLQGEVVYHNQVITATNKQTLTWFGKNKNSRQLPNGIYWAYLKDAKDRHIGAAQKVILTK